MNFSGIFLEPDQAKITKEFWTALDAVESTVSTWKHLIYYNCSRSLEYSSIWRAKRKILAHKRAKIFCLTL